MQGSDSPKASEKKLCHSTVWDCYSQRDSEMELSMITRLAGQEPVPWNLSKASRADPGMVDRLWEEARSPCKFTGNEASLRSNQKYELVTYCQDQTQPSGLQTSPR